MKAETYEKIGTVYGTVGGAIGGSIVPGVGTAIGASVGGLIGGLQGKLAGALFGDKGESRPSVPAPAGYFMTISGSRYEFPGVNLPAQLPDEVLIESYLKGVDPIDPSGKIGRVDAFHDEMVRTKAEAKQGTVLTAGICLAVLFIVYILVKKL